MDTDSESVEKRVAALENEMTRVIKRYEKAQSSLHADAEVSLMHARKAAEAICKQIYINEGCEKGNKPANKLMLNEMIGRLSRDKLIPQRILIALGTIQAFGNLGAHDQGEEDEYITADTAAPCLHALSTVVTWFSTDYCKLSRTVTSSNNQDLPVASTGNQLNQYKEIVETVLVDHHLSLEEQYLLDKKRATVGLNEDDAWNILVECIQDLPSFTMDPPQENSSNLFFHLYEAMQEMETDPVENPPQEKKNKDPKKSIQSHNITNQLAKELVNKHGTIPELSWGNNIPPKKRGKVEENFQIPSNESIICAYDTTTLAGVGLGSFKTGFALCTSGMVYFKNWWASTQCGVFSINITDVLPDEIRPNETKGANSEVRIGHLSIYLLNTKEVTPVVDLLHLFRNLVLGN